MLKTRSISPCVKLVFLLLIIVLALQTMAIGSARAAHNESDEAIISQPDFDHLAPGDFPADQ